MLAAAPGGGKALNTPAHLVMGMAVFGRPGAPAVTVAALAGALAPDLSLYLLTLWEIAVMGTPPERVFRELYFSPTWQAVFRVDNSAPIWGAVLAAGVALRRSWLVAFAGAALLHLAFDLPLHAGDGRPHFWPVSGWVFDSPLSYWDPSHGGHVVGPLEAALTATLAVLVWRRHRAAWARAAVTVLAVAELAPFVMWRLLL